MYRLMFSDLDETLLVNHHVPKVNQEAIFKAREKGLKFVPCTGRAFNMIPEILKEIGTYDQEGEYSLCFNGGLIVENKNNKILHFKGLEFDIAKKITEKIEFPMFVKPSNSGSSVGINKADNLEELIKAIEYAGEFDSKILIEENIKGREIECAVLGNEEVESSCVGEILAADKFYSFSAKYQNQESKTIIPADLPNNLADEVRKIAEKAYKAADCKGLARVDFFVDDINNKIYINEINTLPGFTQISMYPKLWEQTGVTYTDLLDKLIEIAY